MTSSSSQVVFITHSFPPEAEVGGKRTVRFCRYLPEFGIQPTVLTVNPKFYEGCDSTYAAPLGLNVIRTGAIRNPLDWYRRISGWVRPNSPAAQQSIAGVGLTSQEQLGFSHRIRRAVLASLQTPDRNWGWYWSAVRAGVNFVRKRKPAAVISSGPPWTSHLVARAIHRKTGAPWITDFRDPWTLSPWRDPLPAWILKFEEALERSIIEECDRVVCVSEEIAHDFRAHYDGVPSSKFAVITNGFEGEVVFPGAGVQNGTRLLLHLGSLYGDRRIRSLLRAYVNLLDRGAIEAGQCKLLFVGNISGEILGEASEEISFLQRSGALEFRDLVPYSEGQELLAAADVLLILQGNNRVAVPAKLFEYLLTGKPILVTAKPGSLTRLVSRFDLGLCADSDSIEEIATQLQRCLDSPPRTRAEFERIVQRFHFRTLTQELVRVINSVIEPISVEHNVEG